MTDDDNVSNDFKPGDYDNAWSRYGSDKTYHPHPSHDTFNALQSLNRVVPTTTTRIHYHRQFWRISMCLGILTPNPMDHVNMS